MVLVTESTSMALLDIVNVIEKYPKNMVERRLHRSCEWHRATATSSVTTAQLQHPMQRQHSLTRPKAAYN